MRASMRNIGYYQPKVTYSFDTVFRKKNQERIITYYNVIAGKRTLIDTLAYLFNEPELEQLAISSKDKSLLQKNNPVTKNGIQDESL